MVCPRCGGEKVVVAFAVENGKRTDVREELPCPTCHATGEASEEDVDKWKQYLAVCSPWCQCGKTCNQIVRINRMTGEIVSRHCSVCGKPVRKAD